MEQALATLCKAADIQAAAIVGPDGCVTSALSSPLKPEVFLQTVAVFRSLSPIVSTLEPNCNVQRLEINTDIGCLWIRAFEAYVVIALSAPQAKPAIISVTINAAVLQLKRSLAQQGRLTAQSAFSQSQLGNQNIFTQSQVSAAQSSFSQSQLANSLVGDPRRRTGSLTATSSMVALDFSSMMGETTQASSSLITGSLPVNEHAAMANSHRDSSVAPWEGRGTKVHASETDPVGVRVVRQLIGVATFYLGPDALVLVKSLLTQAHTSPQTATKTEFQAVVDQLASKIQEPQRQAFRLDVATKCRV